MLKLLRIFLFAFVLSYAGANELVDRVNDFIKQNQDIAKWNEELKGADESSVGKINQEIKACKAAKTSLLTSFAALINSNNLDANLFKELKASKSPNKASEMEFYECLSKLQKAFVQNKSEDVKLIIDESLTKLKAANAKASNPTIDGLIELLTYLRLNTNIFQSNFVLKQLDLLWLSDQINYYFPKQFIKYINIGKISICAIILVLMLALRKLVLKLLLIILRLVLVSLAKTERESNEYFFNKLKRPVIWLFYSYALRLCCLVGFYPAPTAPLILKIFSIINVILITWIIIAAFNGYGLMFISKLASKSGRKDAINLIIKIANYIIIAIAILVGLSYWGFDVSAIIASLGIGGLAVALAAKDIIANFFASVLLHFDTAFSQGEYIQIGSVEGTVVEIGMRHTIIRTFDNSLVFVPNSSIMNSNITNWNRRKLGRKIAMSIGVEYSCSAEQLSSIIADIKQLIQTHPDIAQPNVDDYRHSNNHTHRYRQTMVSIDDLEGYKNLQYVYLDEFAGSSINIFVCCFTKTINKAEFLAIKEDLMLKIMKIVENNNAGFAFPSTSIYLESTKTSNELIQSLKAQCS